MMINDENKKSVRKMLGGRALYVALCACFLAAGVISYTAMKDRTVAPAKTPAREESTTYLLIGEKTEPQTQKPVRVPEGASKAPVMLPEVTAAPVQTQAVFENEAEPLETPEEAPAPIEFALPLTGAATGKDFSMGVPVFSATMGDYRTHNGVDFITEPGESVRAIAAGTVVSVTKDALFGNSVRIDHGQGVVSTISGLADEGLPYEGAGVDTDTVIGVAGDIPVESADGSHIHLEIRVNGVLRDPLEVMGFMSDQ